MNLLQAIFTKKLSEELLKSAIGMLCVFLLASVLFIASIVTEIQLKKFFTDLQFRRVSAHSFTAYADEKSLDAVFYGKTITNGNRQKKQIALTFDADMTPGMKQELETKKVDTFFDKRIIETLQTTHTKATLFLTGMWIEQYPQEAKTFAQNALFELGNHSYSHPSFSGTCYGLETIGEAIKQLQIQKTQELLLSLTGQENHLFRFPGGCFSERDLGLIKQERLVSILWDVVSGDAFGQNTEYIIQKVVGTVQNGSIVVMHINGSPTAPKTADALPEIIKQLKDKGYEFVKVSEIITK